MSPYQRHKDKWKDCQECPLCKTRKQVVFYRGKIPCEILFVGEGPGDGEDTIGRPFVGPSGELIDKIVFTVLGKEDGTLSRRVAFYNLLGCWPVDENREKHKELPPESVMACTPRIQEFVKIAEPRVIICLGKESQDWLRPGMKDNVKFHRDIPLVYMVHPARILRSNIAQQGLAVQRCEVQLFNAVKELEKNNGQ